MARRGMAAAYTAEARDYASSSDRHMALRHRLRWPRFFATTSPMQSKWHELRARDAIETYAEKGVSEDLALRVYTTRLLGRDPLLVLHGGGNTSVKTRAKDDLGNEHEAIAAKGPGGEMADIEPQGLPAVKLEA